MGWAQVKGCSSPEKFWGKKHPPNPTTPASKKEVCGLRARQPQALSSGAEPHSPMPGGLPCAGPRALLPLPPLGLVAPP